MAAPTMRVRGAPMKAATKPDCASPMLVPPTPSIRWKLRTRPLSLSGVMVWMMALQSTI